MPVVKSIPRTPIDRSRDKRDESSLSGDDGDLHQ